MASLPNINPFELGEISPGPQVVSPMTTKSKNLKYAGIRQTSKDREDPFTWDTSKEDSKLCVKISEREPPEMPVEEGWIKLPKFSRIKIEMPH